MFISVVFISLPPYLYYSTHRRLLLLFLHRPYLVSGQAVEGVHPQASLAHQVCQWQTCGGIDFRVRAGNPVMQGGQVYVRTPAMGVYIRRSILPSRQYQTTPNVCYSLITVNPSMRSKYLSCVITAILFAIAVAAIRRYSPFA